MVFSVPVLYKISTLVDFVSVECDARVPVLYKISTLVDECVPRFVARFPFFTKFLLL